MWRYQRHFVHMVCHWTLTSIEDNGMVYSLRTAVPIHQTWSSSKCHRLQLLPTSNKLWNKTYRKATWEHTPNDNIPLQTRAPFVTFCRKAAYQSGSSDGPLPTLQLSCFVSESPLCTLASLWRYTRPVYYWSYTSVWVVCGFPTTQYYMDTIIPFFFIFPAVHDCIISFNENIFTDNLIWVDEFIMD